MFSDVHMKNCGHHDVSKHRDIKGSDKYVTLDILLKFDILDKMKIKSSESEYNLVRSGKCLISSLVINSKVRPRKYKRKDMPSEMSVRRTFQRLLGSLRNCFITFLRGRGLNISLMTVTFN